MKKLFYPLLFLLGAVAATSAQSALFIDTTIAPQQMVEDFFNTSQVTVSNVAFTGDPASCGYFEAANTDLDLIAGIMLSSGRCADAANTPDVFASTSLNSAGDPQLDVLTLAPTFNASALEFDLVSQTDTLCFIYRFGSEEYPEYVGTNFNDVFAFFVTGPGYADNTNIALVPGTSTPVAINNVNQNLNTQYYVEYDSTGGADAVYDGFTTTLPAKFVVQPGSTYHVKLAVSDASDAIFDSGVFIAINSLGGDSLLSPVAGMLAPVVDGNTVSFTNTSRYGTSWSWDFGDGTTNNERNPAPHTYPQFGPNGDERTTYIVTLITTNYCCADTTTFTVNIGSSGLDEITRQSFQLSPNPAEDFLLVQPVSNDQFALRISDLTGRLLYSDQAAGALRIDLANYLPGVYVLEFQHGNQSAVQRFVKK